MSILIAVPGGRSVVTSPFTVSGNSTGTGLDIVSISLTDDVSGRVVQGSAIPNADGTWSSLLSFADGFSSGDTATLCATLTPGGTNITVQSGPITFGGHGTAFSEVASSITIPPESTSMAIYAQLSAPLGEAVSLLWRIHDDSGLLIKIASVNILAGLVSGGPFRISVPSSALYADFQAVLVGNAFCDLFGNPPGCESSVVFSDIQTTFNPTTSPQTNCEAIYINATSPGQPLPPPPPENPGGPGTGNCCDQTLEMLGEILAAVRRNY